MKPLPTVSSWAWFALAAVAVAVLLWSHRLDFRDCDEYSCLVIDRWTGRWEYRPAPDDVMRPVEVRDSIEGVRLRAERAAYLREHPEDTAGLGRWSRYAEDYSPQIDTMATPDIAQ